MLDTVCIIEDGGNPLGHSPWKMVSMMGWLLNGTAITRSCQGTRLRTAPRICQACWATSTWKRCARMLQREQLDKCRCPFLTVTFNPLMPFPGTGCGACIYIYMYIIDWLHYFALSLEPGHCQNCQLYHAVSHEIFSHNYTHIHTHTYTHTYTYTYIYIYLFIYAHTHTHTHTRR